jgi:hypothetical protein
MEYPLGKQGQEENRKKDRHQGVQNNFLYAFGIHGHMPQQVRLCVKNRIAPGGSRKPKRKVNRLVRVVPSASDIRINREFLSFCEE